jgi:hypothetical protein
MLFQRNGVVAGQSAGAFTSASLRFRMTRGLGDFGWNGDSVGGLAKSKARCCAQRGDNKSKSSFESVQ